MLIANKGKLSIGMIEPLALNHEDKQHQSTAKGASTCRTFDTEIENNQHQAQNQISRQHIKKSQLLIPLIQKIRKLQKAQDLIKQKYEKCVLTLQKQIIQKNQQNERISKQIIVLRSQICEQKKDMQIIKNYAVKLRQKRYQISTKRLQHQNPEEKPIEQQMKILIDAPNPKSRDKNLIKSSSNKRLFKKDSLF